MSLGWHYILDVPAFELNGAILNFFRRIALKLETGDYESELEAPWGHCLAPRGGGVYTLRFKEVTIDIDNKTVS